MALERVGDIIRPGDLDKMWESIQRLGGRSREEAQIDDALKVDIEAEARARNLIHRREVSRSLSRIPDDHRNSTLTTYQYHDGNGRAVAAAERVINSKSPIGLGVWGMSGVGKSHLAAIVANAAIEQGRLTIYMSVSAMLRSIKDTYNPKADQQETNATELAMIKRYAGVDTLVLNDLGKESLTKWSIEMLFAIFDDRWEQGRRLVLTSNLNWPDLLKHYSAEHEGLDRSIGPAMMDRVAGMTELPWIEIRGESQRWGV